LIWRTGSCSGAGFNEALMVLFGVELDSKFRYGAAFICLLVEK
jgi:hypothetical protein